MAAPWLAGMPWPFAVPATLAVLPVSLPLFRWARGTLRKIAWHSDGHWSLIDSRGATHEDVELLRGIHVGARFLALRWRCGHCGKKFRAALLNDNCDEDALRRLTVRLRATPDAVLFADQPLSGTGQ